MSQQTIKDGLAATLAKVDAAASKRAPELSFFKPLLVAVGKTKPFEVIIEAYEAGQRDFGENYVKELVEKATNPQLLEKCTEIKWHFIGHLQTNKINKVLGLKNMHLIETVHSKKLAANLDKAWPKFRRTDDDKLKVLIQINTSGEDEKSGIEPGEATDLTRYVLNDCKNLKLEGLMTIGKYSHDPNDGINPDFVTLLNCRLEVCKNLGLDWKQFQISMGMSADYEQAVELGSNMVRVGTAIFGNRNYKLQAETIASENVDSS